MDGGAVDRRIVDLPSSMIWSPATFVLNTEGGKQGSYGSIEGRGKVHGTRAGPEKERCPVEKQRKLYQVEPPDGVEKTLV